MENTRIIPKKYHLLDHLSLILLHSLGKKPKLGIMVVGSLSPEKKRKNDAVC